jgi:hypothetical protein
MAGFVSHKNLELCKRAISRRSLFEGKRLMMRTANRGTIVMSGSQSGIALVGRRRRERWRNLAWPS